MEVTRNSRKQDQESMADAETFGHLFRSGNYLVGRKWQDEH